ncbi:MAG TPA: DUF4965 domain-containing protein [Phycisphaerales bacterium]|nr:DUF4965 domain-containing protein [Phycisphaerales bacterium]
MKLAALLCVVCSAAVAPAQPAAMKPPAVPLVAHDPYLSVWSMSEHLTDDWPRHWSGGVMGMAGLLWVDGKAYRWCGPAGAAPAGTPVVEKIGGGVTMDKTFYLFTAGGVNLSVEFWSPPSLTGVADDMVQASRSVSAVRLNVSCPDKRAHDVRVYLDVTGEWCSHDVGEQVAWSRHRVEGLEVLSMARTEQSVLRHAGDQRRIDWGRLYLAGGVNATGSVGAHAVSRTRFAQTGRALASDDLRMPRAINDDWPVLAMVVDLKTIQPGDVGSGNILIGYDEGEAIELFGRRLKPLWNADGRRSFGDELKRAMEAAEKRNDPVLGRAQNQFWTDAARVGGDGYAKLLNLAYRQVLAGHKIAADWDGSPVMFSKENTSNGCIGTVDVIYPACPFFLYHNPAMLRAQLKPLMQYAASPRWKFPFAPHDLGTYPKANGQVYGGGETSEENQMPVEESGNMLIMLAALAKVEPKEGVAFCEPYWPVLEKWAGYLQRHGLDPANQLCTDDFAGHLARNVNLSAKTVVALGAYAQLLAAAGKEEEATRWRAVAEEFAATWMEMTSRPAEGATPLVFGDAGKGTWSQKYNLVWDRVLGLGLFPQRVFDGEAALYRTKLQKNGLPLDSRRTYSKLDWTAWSACLTGKRDDFDAVMAPVIEWANATPPPSRVPLSDWYETTTGRTMGMHTRTVVGGLWMPLLLDRLTTGREAQPLR